MFFLPPFSAPPVTMSFDLRENIPRIASADKDTVKDDISLIGIDKIQDIPCMRYNDRSPFWILHLIFAQKRIYGLPDQGNIFYINTRFRFINEDEFRPLY